jgi:tRNA modification GTPase
MVDEDTIAAIATPPGRGGVGIVRVSGPAVTAMAPRLLKRLPTPRQAVHGPFFDSAGDMIDEGLALYFPRPHSFTGDDVLELHGHGGPVVLDCLLQTVLSLGARLARPGEFSERAFLNDKLDLVQAEAIADLIESASHQAARAALRSLQGEFSRRVTELTEQLVEIRMFVESAIDFPDEDIEFLSQGNIEQRLRHWTEVLDGLLSEARQGSLLKEGIHVVIAGCPNAGKSSLLNRLTTRNTAIVTDIPGTTRDVLRETINVDGLPLHVIDTAGLRETGDVVEQHGVARAWNEISRADLVLLVVDDQAETAETDAIRAQLPDGVPVITVRNKIDMTGRAPGASQGRNGEEVALSIKSGEGFPVLLERLKDHAGFTQAGEGAFSARRRHIEALQRARALVGDGLTQLARHQAAELLADDLTHAHHALAEITGEFTSDDLLGRIFSSFCIGK